MQSEPIEISKQLTTTTQSAVHEATQHGTQPLDLHATDNAVEKQGVSIFSTLDDTIGGADHHADNTTRFRQLQIGEHDSSHRPSYQRITEYENASLPVTPRVEDEGPAFKIVKSRSPQPGGPHVDNFPNEVLTHIFSHLPATSLSAVSLVCRRFYSLVTTPHAWRIAFSRFFPGRDAVEIPRIAGSRHGSDQDDRENLRIEQRIFTRLTGLATWRSEYVLRTRLLRSLERGKPSQLTPSRGASSRPNSIANNANPVVTYNSQLFATINHIHAVWGNGKKSPRFIHGTDETGSACSSDPNIGKIDNWGFSDPQSLPQFVDLFPGDAAYGLGDGHFIGIPNVMDVSQPFGMVYGEGFPGGLAYYRSPEEMRGRFLTAPISQSEHDLGIPHLSNRGDAICSVWIAKSANILTITDGLIGIMTGSSSGVVAAYSLGADNLRDSRLSKGEVTARWILSPGVPIIAIAVDGKYDAKRKAAGRIWAVALNALGEVYYLKDTPRRAVVTRGAYLNEVILDKLAWETGRSVYWNFVELTRRLARDDWYHENEYDGSYSPRSSCESWNLSKEQIAAETREIEKFLAYRPAHFRRICDGWDMRRILEVDFAGNDGCGAGEGIVVIERGIEEGKPARVQRLSRVKVVQKPFDDYPVPKTPPIVSKTTTVASLFGGSTIVRRPVVEPSNQAVTSDDKAYNSLLLDEEWRTSRLYLPTPDTTEITTSAIDLSTYALLTASEDPLLTTGGTAASSSPISTPGDQSSRNPSNIPGHRGRFIAVGTKTGSILAWDLRGPYATNSDLVNDIKPLRIIQTDSPQISCLALSALFIVHGGNDGLVQTWDPLASTIQPIRTLNSRFSSRARRRLVQAEASIQGVGINLYAAGAIVIDPDPTVLRGMVSLGTHLRYWSFSSAGADQVASKKRRLRRSERGSNGGPDRYTNTGRGALMDYIATEQEELKRDKERRAREDARLRGRFGVELGGMSEEEALRYAELISQETYQNEQQRINDSGYNGDESSAQSVWSSETVTPEGSIAERASSPPLKTDHELEHDIEEAIRLSLLEGIDELGSSPRASGSGKYDVPVVFKQKKGKRSASISPSTRQISRMHQKDVIAADDLEYALQISLAEEESRRQLEEVAFPSLENSESDKGKERAFV